MEIEINKLPDSEIEIAGEISAGDFESYREQAVKEFSQNIHLDGFRPGKVPEKILIEKVGEQAIMERMAEMAIQKEYIKIIKEKDIQVIGRPEVLITKMAKNNPLGFKIKTAVMPKIELADYKIIASEIMKEKEEISVDEKEVDQTLEYLRKSRAQNNEKNEEILPELNNDFAKTLGKFETLDDLKKVLHQNLEEEKKSKNREQKRIKTLEKIIEQSKIEVPKIIIESEKEKLLEEVKVNVKQTGLTWENYLNQSKKNEEELKNSYEEAATKRAKFGLALNEIAEKEKIEITEEEAKKEAEKMAEYYKNFGQNIDLERVKAYTYGILRNEKVFRLLESC
ncbi:hypothetical protein KJ763_02825 [Patescibacteria group bacterium]|nr:hypothetical protein [Patescibacteria group bacterium]